MRSFKAKNERKFANIIDATQDEQESTLLAKSPEYRRNEMIMLEEFRRRKNMKDMWELKNKHDKDVDPLRRDEKLDGKISSNQENLYKGSGPERYFEH